ncbi:hypothetical protein OKW22_000107 [Bacilli bacterium PM5-3]|nr:hypothetical protein [Bacilli bacterium PM5-3]
MKRIKFSLLMLLAVFTIFVGTDINAAKVGYATGTTATIDNRGDGARVSYEFSIEGETTSLTASTVTFNWDPDLLTLDLTESEDASGRFMLGAFNPTAGSIMAVMTNPSVKSKVTLVFTNALPVGQTATVAPINVTFRTVEYPVNRPDEIEFSGSDGIYLIDAEVVRTVAKVKLNVPITIDVSPKTADVVKGDDKTFTVTTNDTTGVTWSVSGATSADTKVDATGKLSVGADETAKTLTVTATSKEDTTKSASATVTVKDKPGLTLALTPATKQVFKKEATTVQYTATPTTTAAGTTVTYAISGNTEAGTTIDGNGLLTVDANENSSEITITATATNASTNPTTASATAKLSLVEIDVIVNPLTATVAKGYEQKFTATVQNDLNKDGVTWAVSGATSADTKVDANGKLVIGIDETATTLNVTATSKKDTTKSATSVVTVVEKAITINIAVSKSVVKPGTKVDVTSIMENDLKSNGVEWEISGQKTDGTTLETKVGSSAIKSTHKTVLNVGAKEKDGTTIIVKVTSVSDSTKSASAKVVVKNEAKPTPPKPEPKPEPKPTPGTGNDTNLVLLVSMMSISAIGAVAMVTNKLRRNNR